jgi:hypothetical protein
MRPPRALLIAAVIVCVTIPIVGAEPVATKPAATQKTKPGMAVSAAVAALVKEYQAYSKDPKATPLREKSNYFIENPAPDATPDLVVKALEGSVGGGSGAGGEAYVKWQLLSAIPDKFPDELLKRAIAVYRRTPVPSPHPGMNHRALARAVNGLKKEQIPSVQKDFDQAVDRVREENQHQLRYRDELFARLPVKLDAISAGLDDAYQRAIGGLNTNAFFDNVAASVRSWAITDAKPAQVRSMMDTVGRLRDAIGREDGRPYTRINGEEKPVKWAKPESAAIDPKKLDELLKFLENNSTGATAGGLKFKENK